MGGLCILNVLTNAEEKKRGGVAEVRARQFVCEGRRVCVGLYGLCFARWCVLGAHDEALCG